MPLLDCKSSHVTEIDMKKKGLKNIMCFSQVLFYWALFFTCVCVRVQADALKVINNLSETLGWEEKSKSLEVGGLKKIKSNQT